MNLLVLKLCLEQGPTELFEYVQEFLSIKFQLQRYPLVPKKTIYVYSTLINQRNINT